MPYMEKITKSGKLIERERYFASRSGKKIPRSGNVGDTPEDVAKNNERHSQMQLMRLINCNFSAERGDLFVTLTHSGEMDEAKAAKEERNVLARIARLRKKKGLEPLKYIAVTECQGKWHHHLIINGGITAEEVRKLWGSRGRIMVSPLFDEQTYEGLARYLTKQHKPRKGSRASGESNKSPRRLYQKRWHASRNLARPVVTKKIIKRPPTAREPKPPKGYRLLPNWFTGCDCFGNLYTYAAFVEDGTKKQKGRRKRE